jgi:hypothetical protein
LLLSNAERERGRKKETTTKNQSNEGLCTKSAKLRQYQRRAFGTGFRERTSTLLKIKCTFIFLVKGICYEENIVVESCKVKIDTLEFLKAS